MSRALFLFAAVLSAEPRVSVESKYEQAFQALQAGDLAKARVLAQRVTTAAPNAAEGFHLLAIVYSRQGDGAGAEVNFQWALRLRPSYLEARRNLALHLARSGQHTRAIAEFRKLLIESPDSGDAVSFLGRLYFLTRNYTQAVRFLERTHTAEASAMLGVAFFRLGDLARARKTLYALPQEDYEPELASEVWRSRGILSLEEGKMEEAIHAFRAAIAADPANLDASLGLAQAFFKTGRYDQCLEALTAVTTADWDERFLNLQGSAYAKSGKLKLAAAAFRKAIQRNPKLEEAHYNLGLALLKSGANASGIQTLRAASLKFPKSRGVLTTLGIAYQLAGSLVEAQSTFLHVIQLDPRQADGYVLLGSAFMESGDHQKARDHFLQAAKLEPTSARTQYLLGIVNTYLLKSAEARANLSRAVELDKKFCFAYYQLAKIELDNGELEPARNLSGQAAVCDADFAQPHFQMSQILARLGDREGSQAEMRRFEEIKAGKPERKYQVFVLP